MTALTELARRIEQWTGMVLESHGFTRLEHTVQLRVQLLGLPDVAAYLGVLGDGTTEEARRLISAVAVNYSWFFRDGEQMQQVALLLREGWPGARRLSVWVAACASGEEAWSLAMLAAQSGREVELLASDLSEAALARARVGSYSGWATREVPEALAQRYLVRSGDEVRVVETLKERVRFLRHNLLDPPPRPSAGHAWHLVLCRNVLFYFRPTVALGVMERLGATLQPDGYLMLGPGEVVSETPPSLELQRRGNRVALQPRRAGAAPVETPLPPARSPVPTPVPEVRSAPLPQAPQPVPGVTAEEQALSAAMTRRSEGDSVAALRLVDEALARWPGLWPAHATRALCLEDVGQPHTAVEAWRAFLDGARLPIPLPSTSPLHRDLEGWLDELVALARRRSRGRGGR